MHESLENPEPLETNRRGSAITIVAAIVALVAVGGALWLALMPGPKSAPAGQAAANAPMTAAEQAYARKLEVGNIALSRAENFLHQEVTIVNGDVLNAGAEPVVALRLTMEFADDMNQVVLRETRSVLGTPEQLLSPGERRAFEISFEHVPASWNMQRPVVRVSYLRLPDHP